MMEIQKGIVKYKDRTDIVCEYGIVSDKQYYFMPDGKLSNGNIIATTTLVEAIDMEVQPATIGLISPLGEELIPFENKSIKSITDEYLLVEKARPTSVSVISALSSRSDPLAATRLVTTAATKKESLMTHMGTDGKFVFNDQFSEASVFTNDGVNVLNGEYYSFIGLNDNNIYYSTNVVEDQVFEYPLISHSIQDNVTRTDNDVQKEVDESLDVTNVGVSREELADQVEEAMKEETVPTSEGVVQAVEESVSEEPTSLEELATNDEVVATEDNSQIIDNPGAEVASEDDSQVVDNPSEEVASEDVVDDNNQSIIEQEEVLSAVDNQVVDNDSIKEELNIGDDSKEEVLDEFKLNTDNYNVERQEREIPMKKSYYADEDYSRNHYDLDDSYYEADNSVRDFEGDSIIKDVASTMTELIRQNKDQRSKIVSLENRNEQLNEKIHNQSSIIDRQRDEIEHLKTQLQGKKDDNRLLDRLLNDAQSVLRSDANSYDYDKEREYSYRRVA